MITKITSYVRMTMFPMVIFVLTISVMKFGPVTPSFMENRAEASMVSEPYHEDLSMGIYSVIKDWRTSQIIRSSLNYNPAMFYDLTDHDIRKLLGQPSLNRREGQARMIQYVYEGCAADFYYTMDGENKINHYEIRQLDDNEASDCLSEILYNL